jgi:ribosomal protein L11 methyltransferase
VLALVVTVPVDEAELASDVLWSLGVLAIEERGGPTADRVELWTSLGDDQSAVETVIRGALGTWTHRFTEVDERVSETWREFAEPTWVDGDLVVYPAWQAPPSAISPTTTAIAIDPGATFGMGDHPTTILSLHALRDAVGDGSRVLDVGCGSGVLSIAACLFGAATAEAIDISPVAVPVTRANALRNGVGDRVRASTTALGDVEGTFDVVVANILAPALVTLAPDLRRVLDPAGTLIVSGVLANRHQHVLDALTPLRIDSRRDRDGWSAISLRY